MCNKYKYELLCVAIGLQLFDLFCFSPHFFNLLSVINLQQHDGSIALLIASIWTGLVHLGLGVLGTFVLKRFPTSFSVGFLLGVLVVLANQNLILFGTFSSFSQGSPRSNHVFASLGLTLFVVLTFMALLLLHFKQDVVVAPADVSAPEPGTTAAAVGVHDDEESPSSPLQPLPAST